MQFGDFLLAVEIGVGERRIASAVVRGGVVDFAAVEHLGLARRAQHAAQLLRRRAAALEREIAAIAQPHAVGVATDGAGCRRRARGALVRSAPARGTLTGGAIRRRRRFGLLPRAAEEQVEQALSRSWRGRRRDRDTAAASASQRRDPPTRTLHCGENDTRLAPRRYIYAIHRLPRLAVVAANLLPRHGFTETVAFGQKVAENRSDCGKSGLPSEALYGLLRRDRFGGATDRGHDEDAMLTRILHRPGRSGQHSGARSGRIRGRADGEQTAAKPARRLRRP